MAQIKYYLLALAIALACYGTWYATSDHYEKLAAEKQVEADKAVQSQIETTLALMAADADKFKLKEEQHARDQLILNRLSTDVSSVRVSFAGSCAVSASGQTGAGTDGAGRLLSERMDGLFAEFQARVGRAILRCDQLNSDAIQSND